MQVVKRNKVIKAYEKEKVKEAIHKAFLALDIDITSLELDSLVNEVEEKFTKDLIEVEEIQDIVEETLMKRGYLTVARAYILYREEHKKKRQVIDELVSLTKDEALREVFKKIEKKYQSDEYNLNNLLLKFKSFLKPSLTKVERLNILIKGATELISQDAPDFEFIASILLNYKLKQEIRLEEEKRGLTNFYDKLSYLTSEGLYGKYILEHYTKSEVLELASIIDYSYDDLLNYSGLDLLIKRYLIKDHDHIVLESVQEMFLGIAMHLAMLEKEKIKYAKEFYHLLASLRVTMATPTISNARKPFYQMSSCFIDTVGDSLNNIYKSVDNFAKVSKLGGGMGLYFGKVRANGSSIRGFKGAAGGVIRWIKLVNDTAVAVDQLGVRQGACAVYLDAWHRDLPEFLQLRTNNGDDRMKAHDIFPAICYPDLFWKLADQDLDSNWYMMCPHEIYEVKGYHLEDSYGKEWEERYFSCVEDSRIKKRVMSVKEIVRLIIKSLAETGTPFTFNRDHVNRMNPNKHMGVIYSSNLCTEIAQNMREIEIREPKVKIVDGEEIVVEESKAGDFVVCNLASLSLGNFDVKDEKLLASTIKTVVRALDNVIDLNFYPLQYAKITNKKYRPIGLGTSGYHHMLVNNGISFESEKHLEFVDKLYEKINYYTLEASLELAKEKGSYEYFKGSDYDNGDYFRLRNYDSSKWLELASEIHEHGIRNAYLLAIAPTSSTSIIAATTAAVDPIMNKFFMEEKKGSMITRVAPNLNPTTFWLYKNAHLIDQEYVVRSAGVRQRHLDQAQSVNLYITNDYTFRKILNLYILAWKNNVKTIYYVRSKSLEVEECESCSA